MVKRVFGFVIVGVFVLSVSSFLVFGCAGLDDDNNNKPVVPPDDSSRIYINTTNKTFEVDGKRIWINGANTPYFGWNDFGGNNSGSGNAWGGAIYDNAQWDNEFAKLKAAGINATRVWLTCNGAGSIELDSNNLTTVRAKFWTDLDQLFALAVKHKIYIMATLISFDHFKTGNYLADRWQAMIKNKDAVKSFVDNYTIPLVKRYGNNPYLWSIDTCNELDWVYENNGVPLNDIAYFVAYNAAAIHANSDVLVTFGGAMPKYDTDKSGFKNYFSDSNLKSQYNNSGAYVDFWSPHYYDWVKGNFGHLNNTAIYYMNPGAWGMDTSKPSLIGECPAMGSAGKTTTEDYEGAYNNGWQGAMAWTSNGVDEAGSLTQLSPATKNMLSKYRALIYPLD